MKGSKSAVLVGLALSFLTVAIAGCTEEIKDELDSIVRSELDELVQEIVENFTDQKDELVDGFKDDIEQKLDELKNSDDLDKAVVTIRGIDKEYHYDSGTESTPIHFDYYWCTYYAAKEFEKIAPSPGVNWGGDANQWFINAGAKGWETTIKHDEVDYGAIVVLGNHVQIVREVRDDGIVVQGMNEGWATNHEPLAPDHKKHWYGEYKFYTGYVYKYYLSYDQVDSGYVFGDFKGYVLPTRTD